MNDHLMRIAFPVNWKVLENFYKDVDGGLKLVVFQGWSRTGRSA